MQNPTYLSLSRHHIYYFRFPLPKLPEGKVDYIRLSLGTREPKKALLLARSLYYAVSLIMQKHKAAFMKNNEAKAIVTEYCQQVLAKRKREIEEDVLTTNHLKVYLDVVEQTKSGEKLNSTAIDMDESKAMKQLVKATEHEIAKDTDDYNMLLKHYRNAMQPFAEEMLRFFDEQRGFDFAPKKIDVVEKRGLSLAAAIEKFIATKKDDVNDKSLEERKAQLNLLVEILGGDTDIADIDAEKARYVRDITKRVPANVKKNPKTKNLTILQAVEVEGVKPIGKVTFNKYISAYALLFKWCVSEGYLDKAQFETLKEKVKDKDKPPRIAFSDSQIAIMVDELNKTPDGLIAKDYQYWGVLIGMYTGARLNEVAQIGLDDIKQEGGIWYFDMNDDGDYKKLKNSASKRLVPIHDELLKRGILQYKAKLKKLGKTRLLHELNWSRDGYGKNLSRFFNKKFLVKLNLKKNNVNFHCFRHTVNTKLRQVDVELTKVQSIIGHTRSGGASEIYFRKGYTIKQLKAEMDKLDYTVSSSS